jgi:hypothetical protein
MMIVRGDLRPGGRPVEVHLAERQALAAAA